MKILLLYAADKNYQFPSEIELVKEFKCQSVKDLNNINEDNKFLSEEDKILKRFNSIFIRLHSDCVNSIWDFDPNKNSYGGACRAYVLSNDIDKRYIDWWNLKNDLNIRKFQCTHIELNKAIDYCFTANAFDRAHQYSSAIESRKRIIKYHLSELNKSEISYFDKLTKYENNIEIKFNKIKEDMIKRAKKQLKKNL